MILILIYKFYTSNLFIITLLFIGSEFTGLNGLKFPMVCFTAANCSMKKMSSYSTPVSLQMDCLSVMTPMQIQYLSKQYKGI